MGVGRALSLCLPRRRSGRRLSGGEQDHYHVHAYCLTSAVLSCFSKVTSIVMHACRWDWHIWNFLVALAPAGGENRMPLYALTKPSFRCSSHNVNTTAHAASLPSCAAVYLLAQWARRDMATNPVLAESLDAAAQEVSGNRPPGSAPPGSAQPLQVRTSAMHCLPPQRTALLAL